MSLRIPLTKDQTLQVEFHEVERRLRRLEKGVGITPGGSVVRVASTTGGGSGVPGLAGIIARIEAIEQAIASLPTIADIPDFGEVGGTAARGLVPSPGTAEPPTGVAQHVLTEDESWGFPFRGLVQVGTSGEQTQPPHDVLSINGGLQVGAVTASDVELFNLRVGGEVQYYDTFWDDLRVEPTARTTGANAPTFEKWIDDSGGTSRGVYLYSFDDAAAGSEKEIFFSAQLPHSYKEGTAIYPHVHWIGNVSDTTATVRWGLEYAWSDIGEAYSDSVIIYGAGNIPSADEGTPDPDITAFKHYLTSFGPITPTSSQDGISSIFVGRVFRDSANGADTYNAATNKCGLLSIDIHYEVDTPGSRARYVK